MIHLTDEPPENMHISFHCGTIGESLEIQIRMMMAKYPGTGIIFIDTLQLVRNGKPSSANAYEKDYKDLVPIKALADEYDICIFMVHHTRKEKDMKQIQEWLGHSDISTTANIYSHLDYTSKINSAGVLDSALPLPETTGMQEW